MKVLYNITTSLCLLILVATCCALSEDSHVKCNQTSWLSLNAVSTLRPTWERVFERKRRYILFPLGGTLKFTVFLSKGLLALYPRGFNFLIEAAFYYPGPARRIDLIPKPLRPPTTPAPKPVSPTQPAYVYIPGSLIHYKAKPIVKPMKIQRIDENIEEPTYANKYAEKYDNPNLWYTKYEEKYVAKKTQRPQEKWHRWTTPMPEHSSWTRWKTPKPHTRWYRNAPFEHDNDYVDPEFMEPIAMEFPDLELFSDWKHYHTHRDRRQLYHNFEGLSKLLGFDMKLCILRAICDGKQLLLPKGYSLIHDIMRVLFSFPTLSGLEDEYSRVMREDYQKCSKDLRERCPINILDWFKNSSMQKI